MMVTAGGDAGWITVVNGETIRSSGLFSNDTSDVAFTVSSSWRKVQTETPFSAGCRSWSPVQDDACWHDSGLIIRPATIMKVETEKHEWDQSCMLTSKSDKSSID